MLQPLFFFFFGDHSEPVCALSVRRSTVWSLRTGSPGAGGPVAVRGQVAIDAFRWLIGVWIARAHHLGVFAACAWATLAFARELGDGDGQLELEGGDSLLDDHVGFEVADALHVEVEGVRFGVVVEGLVGGGRRLPRCVLGDRPA